MTNASPSNIKTSTILGPDGTPAKDHAVISRNVAKTYAGQTTLVYRGRALSVDKDIECEIYRVGVGSEAELMVHTMCPKCEHALKIEARNKRIEWTPGKVAPDGVAYGGSLFIEPFTCTWEMTHDPNDRQMFGLGLCGLRVAYEGREIKDA